MSNSFNQAIIVGNLGHDPELARTTGGKSVLSMSFATSRRFKDAAGEWKTRTDWHRVVAWEGVAEASAKYLKKGDRALVVGELQTRKYSKDGVEHSVTEIVARDVRFLGGRKGAAAETTQLDEALGVEESAMPADEYIPF